MKKDIGKILTNGSAKQRINLILEDVARGRYSSEPLLSDHEFKTISDSFKTTADIKMWNKARRVDETVSQAIVNLQGLMFEVKMHYSNLRGYILVWNTIESAELLINSILHQVNDPEERKRIAENGAAQINLLFSKTSIDQEGYIDLQVDFEKEYYRDKNGKSIGFKEEPTKTKKYSLLHLIQSVKRQSEESFVKFISWRKALIDYMEDEDFNISTYNSIIESVTKEVYTPVIGWDKYISGKETFLENEHGRLDKLKSKYAVSPDIGTLEVSKEQYDWFVDNFIKG